jgi:hypothetical protein
LVPRRWRYAASSATSACTRFGLLEDPRVSDGQRHRLCDLLVIALYTVL